MRRERIARPNPEPNRVAHITGNRLLLRDSDNRECNRIGRFQRLEGRSEDNGLRE